MYARKVILVGNPGTGKSTMGNAFMNCRFFEEGQSPTAVTKKVACATQQHSDGTYLVVDTPGLLEANNTNLKRNAECLKEAFDQAPATPTIVFFVISATGGRLTSEDVATFRAFNQSAQIHESSIVIVVNQVPSRALSQGATFTRAFQNEFASAIGKPLLCLLNFVFIESSSGTQRQHELLFPQVYPLLPKASRASMNQRIESEQEELERRQAALRADQERLRVEREAASRRQRELEAKAQEEAKQQRIREEAERERLRREAQRQAEEAERLREEAERRRQEERCRNLVAVRTRHGIMLVPAEELMFQQMLFGHRGFGGGFFF